MGEGWKLNIRVSDNALIAILILTIGSCSMVGKHSKTKYDIARLECEAPDADHDDQEKTL